VCLYNKNKKPQRRRPRPGLGCSAVEWNYIVFERLSKLTWLSVVSGSRFKSMQLNAASAKRSKLQCNIASRRRFKLIMM
jgi:hypothetical protein